MTNKKAGQTERCGLLVLYIRKDLELSHGSVFHVIYFGIFLPYTMPLWSEDPVEQEYRSQYIIAGIDAIIRVWATRGFQESVEEVVEIVKKAQGTQVPLRKTKMPR